MAERERAVLKEVQDTFGLPWAPDSWQALARAPEVASLLWARVGPVVGSGQFLRESVALLGHAFRTLADSYGMGEGVSLLEADRRGILQELDALLYGEAQLLLQHSLLQLALREDVAGRQGPAQGTRPRSAYRRRVLEEVEPELAPQDVQRLWADMQDALNLTTGVPVNARVLAKWIGFLEPSWRRFKAWRNGGRGFFEACTGIARRAEAAARELSPAVSIDRRELYLAAALDRSEVGQVAQQAERFAAELPGIVMVDAFFRVEAAVHPEYRERIEDVTLTGGWA